MQIPSFRVDDQIALVTGSGRGIGEAIAYGLAAHGAHVVITEVPDRMDAARADSPGLHLRGGAC